MPAVKGAESALESPAACTAAVAPADTLFMDHRFGRRFRCGAEVRLSTGEGLEGAGWLLNVSLSGAYVKTDVPLPLFARVDVVAKRPGRRVDLSASIVRRDATGFGIEWTETPTRPICQIFGCTQECEIA